MEENLNENMNQNETAQETAASSEVPVRRRRQKTKAEIFKETTLPLIILGIAAVLILVFIVGSVVRGIQKKFASKLHTLSLQILSKTYACVFFKTPAEVCRVVMSVRREHLDSKFFTAVLLYIPEHLVVGYFAGRKRRLRHLPLHCR